ncbi:MAG TPA: hypothetical protein VGZ29_16515 [Terriglobia bacterium]|nr:hypothetical protein [Terriglobia bacterium]
MAMKKDTVRTLIMLLLLGVMAAAPVYAGSAVIGSVAGSLNATVGGQALAPNTVIFSGDSLQVKDGAAVVALDNGNRMAFGRETEASFLRESNAVEVLLGHGNVSMYQADGRTGLAVKAGEYEIAPASGYKTLGEVAMLNGVVTVTSKEGALKVAGEGRTVQVAQGKTVTLTTTTSRTPAPQTGGSQKLSSNTDELLDVGALAAGVVAAILAGISISRANDAKTAADNATSAADSAAAAANSAVTAAGNATSAATSAANNANLAGCALNQFNFEVFGTTYPSPYLPPSGFSCP